MSSKVDVLIIHISEGRKYYTCDSNNQCDYRRLYYSDSIQTATKEVRRVFLGIHDFRYRMIIVTECVARRSSDTRTISEYFGLSSQRDRTHFVPSVTCDMWI